jgi:hypothetical protein
MGMAEEERCRRLRRFEVTKGRSRKSSILKLVFAELLKEENKKTRRSSRKIDKDLKR